MKEWVEKVKNWIQDNPALAAVIAGVLAFVGYTIFKPSGATSPAMYSAAVSPSPAGTGGGTSGGGGGTGDSGTLPAVAGFFSAFYDQMKGLFTTSQEAQTEVFSSLADMQESNVSALEALANKVNALTAIPTPTVEKPPALVRQMPGDTEYYEVPTAKIVGGSGGGVIIGNKQTLDNWYGGGSQTSGSGFADFTNWTPTDSRSGASVGENTSNPSSDGDSGISQANSGNWA